MHKRHFALAAALVAAFLPAPLPAQVTEDFSVALHRIAQSFAEAVPGKTIAVFDFPDMQDRTNDLTRFISENMTTEFVKATRGRSRVVERRQVIQVLTELNLIRSNLTTSEIAAAAKQMGANAVVLGSVQVVGQNVSLNARIVTLPDATIETADNSLMKVSSDLLAMANTGYTELRSSQSNGGFSQAPPKYESRAASAENDFLRMTVESAAVSANANNAALVVTFENKSREDVLIAAVDGATRLSDSEANHWYVDNLGMQTAILNTNGTVVSGYESRFTRIASGERQTMTYTFSSGTVRPTFMSLSLSLVRLRNGAITTFTLGVPRIPVGSKN